MASTEEPDGPGCGGDRGECECEDECDDPALQVGHHGGPPTPAQSAAASEVSGTREETKASGCVLAPVRALGVDLSPSLFSSLSSSLSPSLFSMFFLLSHWHSHSTRPVACSPRLRTGVATRMYSMCANRATTRVDRTDHASFVPLAILPLLAADAPLAGDFERRALLSSQRSPFPSACPDVKRPARPSGFSGSRGRRPSLEGRVHPRRGSRRSAAAVAATLAVAG